MNQESIEKGKELYTSVGCATCHSLSKDKLYGPSLHNILETNITVVRNGVEHAIIVDRDYIKKAIIDPDYEKPVSYQSSKMPTPMLSDTEIEYLVDYLMAINQELP